MNEPLKVISTRDGSSTIYHKDLDETYHSMHGALTESQHVFINNGLKYFHGKYPQVPNIKIFEVGFGTGLNTVLAYNWAFSHQHLVRYHGIEGFPLPDSVISKLDFFSNEEHLHSKLNQFHLLKWDQECEVNEYFSIQKTHDLLDDYPLKKEHFNIIFYDAFAPSKQPEMWEKRLLDKVIKALSINGIFVTYCAKGQLKRDLKDLGCEVETLPGPPGKKEMVRATKIHTPFQE